MPRLHKNHKLCTDLAAYAHEAWSGWMDYLFTKGHTNGDGTFTINADSCDRWHRQAETQFHDLPAKEQASDYAEADKMLVIFERHLENAGADDSEPQSDGDPYEGMSTDRAFLEELADYYEGKTPDHPCDTPTLVRNLRSIAIGCDQLMLEKQRLASLVEKVDKKLCEEMERWLKDEGTGTSYDILAAIWLLSRRTQSAGTTHAIGAGLGGLLGMVGREPGVMPGPVTCKGHKGR